MGNTVEMLLVDFNAGVANVGHDIGMTLVWFVVHPLAALPGAILLVITIVRSLAEE